jgi:hypothetical protein
MFVGLVRTESCDQDCATRFYATGAKGDQLNDASKAFRQAASACQNRRFQLLKL